MHLHFTHSLFFFIFFFTDFFLNSHHAYVYCSVSAKNTLLHKIFAPHCMESSILYCAGLNKLLLNIMDNSLYLWIVIFCQLLITRCYLSTHYKTFSLQRKFLSSIYYVKGPSLLQRLLS